MAGVPNGFTVAIPEHWRMNHVRDGVCDCSGIAGGFSATTTDVPGAFSLSRERLSGVECVDCRSSAEVLSMIPGVALRG